MHLKSFFFTLHIFNFFYLKINKANINNNIIDSFQNRLNNLLSSTGFCLKSKVLEVSHKGKNMFFNFWALLKIYILKMKPQIVVVTYFSCRVVIQ